VWGKRRVVILRIAIEPYGNSWSLNNSEWLTWNQKRIGTTAKSERSFRGSVSYVALRCGVQHVSNNAFALVDVRQNVKSSDLWKQRRSGQQNGAANADRKSRFQSSVAIGHDTMDFNIGVYHAIRNTVRIGIRNMQSAAVRKLDPETPVNEYWCAPLYGTICSHILA